MHPSIWRLVKGRSEKYEDSLEAACRADVKLTFEELTTVTAHIESFLNSRPLISMPENEDGTEALTPNHFLIGRPLELFPDAPASHQSSTLLRQWHHTVKLWFEMSGKDGCLRLDSFQW